MNICLSKKRYMMGEIVEGEVNDNDQNIPLEIFKVTKHFNFLIYQEIKPVSNRFSVNIDETGLYICRGCEPNTDIKAFSYGIDEETDVDTAIIKIYREREASFSREKHADEAGNKHFDIYMFCENINPKVDCEYNDVRIIPYNHYNQMGEYNFVNKFMEEYSITNDKLTELDCTERYSAVFKMDNVVAIDCNSAGKYAVDRMTVLLNLYAVQDMCNPRIIMSVVMDRDTKELYKHVNSPRFSGNLLQIGDYGETLLDWYHICVNNKQFRFLLSLARDAYSEMKADIKTYRLWLVLEYITFIFEIKGSKNENIIMKLVKERAPEYYKESLCNGLNMEQFLDVCLQRRHCCTHQGGCLVDSDGKCNSHLTHSSKRREVCRKYPVPNTSFMNDEICIRLEWLVKSLIFSSINHFKTLDD